MQETSFTIEPALDKHLPLTVKGWNKIQISYSTEIYAGNSYLCWKIDGTDHVFKIQSRIVYENHGMNYPEHFQKTLEIFRDDFIEWAKESFKEDWMQKYKIFQQFIING